MEHMITNIRDRIDLKLKSYLNETKESPKYIILDTYSYVALKEDLGYNYDDELSTYHGFEIAIKTGEDITDVNYVSFAR